MSIPTPRPVDPMHRIFTGTMPDGSQVLVQLWDQPGDPGAEVAFRPDPRHTWGVPVRLREEAS